MVAEVPLRERASEPQHRAHRRRSKQCANVSMQSEAPSPERLLLLSACESCGSRAVNRALPRRLCPGEMASASAPLDVFPARSREAVQRAVDAAVDAALRHVGSRVNAATAP